jgi:hypothetical protein
MRAAQSVFSGFPLTDVVWVLDGWQALADGGTWRVELNAEGNDTSEEAWFYDPKRSDGHRQDDGTDFVALVREDGSVELSEHFYAWDGLMMVFRDRTVGTFQTLREAALWLVQLTSEHVAVADALAALGR